MYLFEQTFLTTLICGPIAIFLTWYGDSGWYMVGGLFSMTIPYWIFLMRKKECKKCGCGGRHTGVGGTHCWQYYCYECKEFFWIRIRHHDN